ncbi:MAG: VWA domain-containing protein [Oceanospirillaceae bacterium]|nr:VWA domain-containing protein [Oceanospirillaceae bacterium]
MLVNFFYTLRRAQIPVSIKEYLVLLEALQHHLAFADMDDFYHLARICLVKDEANFDKFDRVFGAYFKQLESLEDVLSALIPEQWLRAEFMKQLSDEDKAKVKSLGGLEKLLDTFKERLKEQEKRHQGGSKWIGTGGTSPFGHSGYHPEGIRVGGESRNNSAAKVWEKRQFKDLDDSVVLGTRNIKVALRKLRQFARTGAADELDLDHTISATAKNAGMLDLKLVPERHNAVKVLLMLDVGGSMDPYVTVCEELFAACRSEFKHLEHFYFHNFVYESLWRNNMRRHDERTSVYDIIHTYGRDYKVIFVGDASMSPYEINSPYGSVEHMNAEPGHVWMQRLTTHFDTVAWLNPVTQDHWHYTQSVGMTQQLMDQRMYPMSLSGLSDAIKALAK